MGPRPKRRPGLFLMVILPLGVQRTSGTRRELLALFALYFERIRFWEDEDSGHWEERRKVGASSIGTVLAGLRAYGTLGKEHDLSMSVQSPGGHNQCP